MSKFHAARRESGSRCPWLGEAAPQPECCSVCAQKAPIWRWKNKYLIKECLFCHRHSGTQSRLWSPGPDKLPTTVAPLLCRSLW